MFREPNTNDEEWCIRTPASTFLNGVSGLDRSQLLAKCRIPLCAGNVCAKGLLYGRTMSENVILSAQVKLTNCKVNRDNPFSLNRKQLTESKQKALNKVSRKTMTDSTVCIDFGIVADVTKELSVFLYFPTLSV